jgi:hypothetical protein
MEGIVTPEEQAEVKGRLQANMKGARRRARHEYLLSGLVRCGTPRSDLPGAPCGYHLGAVRRGGGRTTVYRCGRRYLAEDTTQRCCRTYVPTAALDRAVWVALRRLLSNPEETLRAALVERYATARLRAHEADAELLDAHAALEAAQAALNKLAARNAVGAVDDVTYAQVQPGLLAARDGCAERLEAARAGAVDADDVRRIERALREALARGPLDFSALEEETPEAFTMRRRLVLAWVRAVEVGPGGAWVEFHGQQGKTAIGSAAIGCCVSPR